MRWEMGGDGLVMDDGWFALTDAHGALPCAREVRVRRTFQALDQKSRAACGPPPKAASCRHDTIYTIISHCMPQNFRVCSEMTREWNATYPTTGL
jgi:hypothetical protein